MKKVFFITYTIIAVSFISCNNYNHSSNLFNGKTDTVESLSSDYLVSTTVWYQKSAENRALYYQCYNYAKLALDNQLRDIKGNKKPAVVLDIDETVLNNSPYQGMLIHKGLSYETKTWKQWTKLAKAKALPGAVEFTNYAKSKGCEVFYVSNRENDEKEATILNLKNENFPYADDKHLFLRINKESSKIPRYNFIAEEYQILLFIGDNLSDFENVFENRTSNYGFDDADSLKDFFGEKFILLPNPMYGDWEKAIYGGKYPANAEKSKLLKQAITTY